MDASSIFSESASISGSTRVSSIGFYTTGAAGVGLALTSSFLIASFLGTETTLEALTSGFLFFDWLVSFVDTLIPV